VRRRRAVGEEHALSGGGLRLRQAFVDFLRESFAGIFRAGLIDLCPVAHSRRQGQVP